MGWIIAMFDLPVITEEERRAATKFRKDLLEDGYIMLQFSIYARPCVSLEQLQSYTARVETYAPNCGNVRLMFITDEQWRKTILIANPAYYKGKHDKDPKIPRQITFWE